MILYIYTYIYIVINSLDRIDRIFIAIVFKSEHRNLLSNNNLNSNFKGIESQRYGSKFLVIAQIIEYV